MKILLTVMVLLLVSGLTINGFAQSSIDIESDKSSYGPGDIVNISGSANDAEVIAVEIKDSSGQTILIRTVSPDSMGNFDLSFKVPSTAESGALEIISSGNVGGIAVQETKNITISDSKNDFNPTSNPSSDSGGCLIATAAFGTELAPQVQFLREIRDNTVMSTASGVSFMTGFNQLYYSFSPTIADMERENPMFQEAVRAFITPMISTLSIMTLADEGSEIQVLGLGISVIALNIGMYVAAPAFGLYKLRKLSQGTN